MLISHGDIDPVFSVNDTIAWKQRLYPNHVSNASGFARLYQEPDALGTDGVVTVDMDFLSASSSVVSPRRGLAGMLATKGMLFRLKSKTCVEWSFPTS